MKVITHCTIAISYVGSTFEQIQNSGNHVGEIKQTFVLNGSDAVENRCGH